MTERTSAPRHRVGGLARRLAVIAALTGLTTAALAAPAFADNKPAGQPTTRSSTTTAVPGDLDGDGVPDVAYPTHPNYLNGATSGLTVLSTVSEPYTASDDSHTPDGKPWFSYLVTHHGSLTKSRTDDLLALNPTAGKLYLVPNDANYGGTPGHFTHPDQATTIAKPACAAPADCTGYSATWNSTTQLVATDGSLNSDGLPDVITVEGGRLWYYPGKAGSVLGNPVQLGTGDWTNTTVVAPGKVGGTPTLWTRDNASGVLTSHPLAFNADGTPGALVPAPAPSKLISGTPLPDGTHPCAATGSWGPSPVVEGCDIGATTSWVFGTDGTIRSFGGCLDSTDADAQSGSSVYRKPCSGDRHQSWTPGPGHTLVDPSSGNCLTAVRNSYNTSYSLQLLACTGVPEQTWGTPNPQGSADLGPLPAAQPVMALSIHQDPLGGWGYPSTLTSTGDAGGSATPDLFELDSSISEYPGQPAVDGSARFGTPVPLGYSYARNSMLATFGYLESGAVLYSACAKLTMQADGNLVLTKLKTGQTAWSSNTGGHPSAWAQMAYASQGLVKLLVYDGNDRPQLLWSSGNSVGAATATMQDDCNLVLRDSNGSVLWSTQTYDPAYETTGAAIPAGTVLHAGDSRAAAHSHLDMQADGNLVLYSSVTGHALWSTTSWGHPGATATMQPDGNLVVYDVDNQPLWNSYTAGHPGARTVVQNDRNLVVYDLDYRPLFNTGTTYFNPDDQGNPLFTGTVLHPGNWVFGQRSNLTMQTDGNLVLYSKATGIAMWASGTNNNPGAWAVMQADGNLVVYAAAGNAIWRSNTWGNPGAHAVFQRDNNFVIYDGDGKPLWAAGTEWFQ